jgi:hypothetical protein
VDGVNRLFDEALGGFEFLSEVRRGGVGLGQQAGEAEIDAGERLGDDVMQVPANAFAFVFLGGDETTGEVLLSLPHEAGFLQQLIREELTGGEGVGGDLLLDEVALEFVV